MRQLSFLPSLKISSRLDHGGDVRKGKRKIARPFDPKRPLHVVMRSSRATGEWSMLRAQHRRQVEKIVSSISRKYGVRIHRFVNVGNHLHFLVSVPGRYTIARANLASFFRMLAGSIAQAVTQATKSKPQGRFWDHLLYSRVVSWGREFEAVMQYLIKNMFESAGVWNRKKYPEWELVTLKCGPPI